MRPVLMLAALAATITLLIQLPTVQAASRTFVAHLSGASEVAPVETDAVGQAVMQLSADGLELHYRLIVANLEGATQAHIHCAPAGENGPVVAFLFSLAPDGVTANGVLAEGVITDADVIPRADSAGCPGGITTLADLVQKIESGRAYVNVHTLANPGGEIRGQLR